MVKESEAEVSQCLEIAQGVLNLNKVHELDKSELVKWQLVAPS